MSSTPAPSTPPEAELLLDRLLSASTPSDCLDSLDQLQTLCHHHSPNNVLCFPLCERNRSVLHALCSLVASSSLPSQHDDALSGGGGMEVEGGDVAACEFLLSALPCPPTPFGTNATVTAKGQGGATTESLQKQRFQKRRLDHISKTLLHFHEVDDKNDNKRGMVSNTDGQYLALTPSLLDCLCSNVPSVYARVLSIKLLQSLLSASPGTLREQLITAPDGVNRLVDLLGHGSTAGAGDPNPVPEEVRNEAILFLTSLASSSSVLARLVTFSEGYDRALKIASESSLGSSGGLSRGSTVTMDCLGLCLALARADDVARELFLGGGDGRGNLDRLACLVDLRGGERFRDTERNMWWDRELKGKRWMKRGGDKTADVEKGKGEKLQKQSAKKVGRRGRQLKVDDLDDILDGASKMVDAAQSGQSQQLKPIVELEDPPTPYLTPNETKIVDSAFDLLLVLLHDGEHDNASSSSQTTRLVTETSRSKRRRRAKTVMCHDLARYVFDCALYTLPPPGVDYVSAVPPAKLQQKALVAMAALGSLGDTIMLNEVRKNDPSKENDTTTASRKKEAEEESRLQTQLLLETMPIYLRGRVTAIDRLMYLCCTGAYSPPPPTNDNDFLDDDERPETVASLLSTFSISAFRSCLPAEIANRMMLHALAPPPPDEMDEMGTPLEPPIVTKLVMTLADNLRFLQSHKQHNQVPSEITDVYRATIGASGSAGALGVFLTQGEGDATREMLLRLTPPPPAQPMEGTENANVDHCLEPSNLINFILQHVATYDPDAYRQTSSSGSSEKLHSSAAYVAATLLRLLCEWVSGFPRAASEALSSPSSAFLGVLVRSRRGSGGGGGEGVEMAEVVPALSGLFLGLCLEHMTDSDGSAVVGRLSAGASPDEENVAWTKDTIMAMIQSQGVGIYLAMLDRWRRRPLPLPYCSGIERSWMERREFARWYGRNLALVRRRVVATLAGICGEDDSDSDTERASDTAERNKKSLCKMLSSQAQDMEDLQSKLEESLTTIVSQSTQIKELRRVAELGTSAEINDLIAEFVEKLSEIEKAKIDLAKEADRQAKLQEDALATKEYEIESIRRELHESQASLHASLRDHETLSEEMVGLSAAYNLLEEQYHRSNSSSTGGDGNDAATASRPTQMTAGGEITGAENGNTRNAPGRGSNSQEVQSLREENKKLRDDVFAANDWISMAVSRMEEMGAENKSLACSLEKSRCSLAAAGSSNADATAAIQVKLKAFHEEAQSAREEAEITRVTSEKKMKAKDEELGLQRALVHQLEDLIEEMKINSSTNEESSLANARELEELKQASSLQSKELENLLKANKDSQDWMANAVTHVGMLTKKVQDKDEQLQQMTEKLQAAGEASSTYESKMARLENSLSDITSQRDGLQTSLAKAKEALSTFQELNEDLRKTADVSQVQDSSEKDALKEELDRIKLDNVTLTSNLNEFQSWSETVQGRLAEAETQLQEAVAEREDLVSQLEKTVSNEGEGLSSQEDRLEISALQQELHDKQEQLEQVQDQLLQVKQEHEAEAKKLRADLEADRRRVEELTRCKRESSLLMEGLSLEKALLSSALAEKQVEVDSIAVDIAEANSETEEAQRRVGDLQDAKAVAKSQFAFMTLEDRGREDLDGQIVAISVERDQLRKRLSQLEDVTEDFEEVRESLKRVIMEKDNLMARNLALEQDNKSLECQLRETKGMLKEGDDLLASANAENSTLQAALDKMKMSSEEAIAQWEEREKSLNANMQSLEVQLEQQEKDAAKAIVKCEARCLKLEGNGAGDPVREWEEKARSLEVDIQSLEGQLVQQEKETTKVITQWESRCLALEESAGDVNQQWESRVKLLEADIESLGNQLEQQEKDAAEAVTQWEARCSTLEESGGVVIRQWDDRVKVLEGEVTLLEDQLLRKENEAAEAIAQWQERGHSLEADVQSLETQIKEKEREAVGAIAQWEARCSALEESGGNVVHQWEERVKSLEADVQSLENQLVEKENEATEAIAQWEARCLTLEDSSADILRQWEERVTLLETDVQLLENQLADKENEAAEAMAQWEARCLTLEEDGGLAIHQWEGRAKSLEGEVASLENQLDSKEKESAKAVSQWEAKCSQVENSLSVTQAEAKTISEQNQSLENSLSIAARQVEVLEREAEENAQKIDRIQLQLKEKDEALASCDEQVSDLVKESEQVVKQWQDRSEQLEVTINELEDTIQEHENSANDAIAQWEARCTTLNERIEVLELQLATNENDNTISVLKAEVTSITTKLDASNVANEKTKKHLQETKDLLALRVNDWKEKEASYTSSIGQLESRCSEQRKKQDEQMTSLDSLKNKCAFLEGENMRLKQEWMVALRENEESQIVVLELKEEMRLTKEELQSFATDQFTAKATEMATQALRQQMAEVRSQYAAEQEALVSEKEARRVAEEEVRRLKSDLGLLAQATEYNEDVDVYVRKMAKKVSAENVKTERKEMEELRSTLEGLREELGSCRWKERESEEKAANARLQMSILEQEVSSTKTDLLYMEQAMDELENSKIEISVSLKYHIEAMENEGLMAEQSHEKEINGIKGQLAQSNQDRDDLAHKLELSEKANAALVYSTSYEGHGGMESESELLKLQLERARLLAKINEMGTDSTRRVKEAVAAQVSTSEAELIVEKQSRKSVESALENALSELEEVKTQLSGLTLTSVNGELAVRERVVQDLEKSLGEMHAVNDELVDKNKLLQVKLDTAQQESKCAIHALESKLQKAEECMRLEERESRFEAAIASEIVNLRGSNDAQKLAQALVLRGKDENMEPNAFTLCEGKESIDHNSVYIIEMYDYVVELKQSITEERQMYKDLLAEHEDLLALLGLAGLNGMQFHVC